MTATIDVAAAEAVQAMELADGLRRLANAVETHPELAAQLKGALLCGWTKTDDPKAEVTRFVRGMKRLTGRPVDIEADGYYRKFVAHFGPLSLKLWTSRSAVCEKVVTTRTVTKKVPDPAKLAEVPEIEVTEAVEIVEWRCAPILAEGDAA